MSLIHIRLNRIFNNDETVSYRVESFDFSSSKRWEELGLLHISKVRKTYRFVASQLAESNKLIPPELYLLSEEEKQRELDEKYSDYGCGAWSICINHWANTLIKSNKFPEKYPI